jgi:hypothetical protein
MENEPAVTAGITPRIVRTLRFTGRKRIERECVRLRLILAEDGRAEAFEGTLDLRGLELPGNAQVIITAERGYDAERFELGTLGEGLITVNRTPLGELGAYGSSLRFRVQVVDPGTKKILASAERLRLFVTEEESILPCRPWPNMGRLAWKLDFQEEGPLLLLNKELPRGAFASHQFACYALPAILREILTRAIRERAEEGGEWEEIDGQSEDWKSQWFKFIEELTGREAPRGNPDDPMFKPEYENWLDEVTRVFCEKQLVNEWKRLREDYGHD